MALYKSCIIIIIISLPVVGLKVPGGLKQKLKTKLEWLLVRWIHGKRVVQKHQIKTLDRHGNTLEYKLGLTFVARRVTNSLTQIAD